MTSVRNTDCAAMAGRDTEGSGGIENQVLAQVFYGCETWSVDLREG
jgi:hypothetical protein